MVLIVFENNGKGLEFWKREMWKSCSFVGYVENFFNN